MGGVPGDADGRPRNILFISCKGVRISGISMRNSALWNQHYLDCEDVIVEHIHVFNHCNGNNDGIDIEVVAGLSCLIVSSIRTMTESC